MFWFATTCCVGLFALSRLGQRGSGDSYTKNDMVFYQTCFVGYCCMFMLVSVECVRVVRANRKHVLLEGLQSLPRHLSSSGLPSSGLSSSGLSSSDGSSKDLTSTTTSTTSRRNSVAQLFGSSDSGNMIGDFL
jgi:hypothetical protein